MPNAANTFVNVLTFIDRVLTFWKYLHLFTMAEECFTRCKNFDEQPIFKVFARPSAAVPKGEIVFPHGDV